MKRMLLTSLLCIAGQIPVQAVPQSKLIEWAQDDVTKAMVAEGLSSLKTDAKVLGAAIWDVIPSTQRIVGTLTPAMVFAGSVVQKSNTIIKNHPLKVFFASWLIAGELDLIANNIKKENPGKPVLGYRIGALASGALMVYALTQVK